MRPSHAFEKTRTFLLDNYRGLADADGRLPPIRDLATRAGVSVDTMRKAVLSLRERGLVSVRPGRGVRVAGPASPTASTAGTKRATPAWQRVRTAIGEDLLKKTFAPGAALPYAKELTARYGCCFRTLSRALEGVMQSGLLVRENHRLVSPLHRAPRTRNTIVVIVRGTDSSQPVPIGTWAPRNRRQFEALERYTAEAGCRLAFAVYQYKGDRIVGPDDRTLLPGRIGGREDVLGFMFWAQGLDDLDPAAYVRDLERFGKPVAVLDVDGRQELHQFDRRRACRVFGLGVDERCGEIMGEYLLGLGHRRIDYLGARNPLPRLAGLRRACERAGIGDAVTELRLPEYGDALAHEDIEGWYEALLRLVRGDPSAEGLRPFLELDRERIVDKAEVRIRFDSMRSAIVGALDKAAGTALVCENDALALYCLAVLRSIGVRVPQDRSLAGFDDEEEAFLSGLSSYDFNAGAVIGAMVEFILRPDKAPRAPSRSPAIVDGTVRGRSTTSPPGEVRQWILA